MQPFTDRSLKLPGAHVITDSRKVFGGPLTQITLLATKQTKEKNPTLFQAVANALEPAIRVANAGKRQAAALWTQVQKAPRKHRRPGRQLNDPGFEFTSRPQRIAHFTAFLNRVGTLKAKIGNWKELFWETAHHQQGNEPRPVADAARLEARSRPERLAPTSQPVDCRSPRRNRTPLHVVGFMVLRV